MKHLIAYTFLFATAGLPVYALAAGDYASHATGPRVASAVAPLSEGQIRKVGAAAGKLTIKHGPLENLGMPAMTMVFRVKDAAMLEQVKPGDHVRFLAEKVDGALTVSKLEVVTP